MTVRESAPTHVVIALVGPSHARLVRDSALVPVYPPMGYLVWRGSTDTGGPAVYSFEPRIGSESRLVLGDGANRAFSGYYEVPALTPSPPAADAF